MGDAPTRSDDECHDFRLSVRSESVQLLCKVLATNLELNTMRSSSLDLWSVKGARYASRLPAFLLVHVGSSCPRVKGK